MDATQRPLAIPPEMMNYGEKHQIFNLLKEMMERVLISRPDDPLTFMVEFLRQENQIVPRAVVLGPPVSGKKSIAQIIGKRISVPVIHPSELKMQSDLKSKQNHELTSMDWARLVEKRLQRPDCERKGWILVDFPRTDQEALALQTLSIFPRHVVMLDLADDVALERAPGKRIDTRNGDIYHTTFEWPTDVEAIEHLVEPVAYTDSHIKARLREYHRHVESLMLRYKQFYRLINADQPKGDLVSKVMSFLSTNQRTGAPFTPRVVFLGPTGSGKSYQAARICQKYDLVNVSCSQLIKQQIAEQSKLGMAIKIYVERDMMIPDGLILQILNLRLAQADCVSKGWVLHGYPMSREQAEQLQYSGYVPNRVIFLNISIESIMERITMRRLDPVTGRVYHLLYNPPMTQQISERLQQHPKDTEEHCRGKYQQWLVHEDELLEYYQSTESAVGGQRRVVNIDADQDPHTVFESLESAIAEPLTTNFGPNGSGGSAPGSA